MSAQEVRALLDRQTACLRALLPEPEHYRLLLALAASELLAELRQSDPPTPNHWRH